VPVLKNTRRKVSTACKTSGMKIENTMITAANAIALRIITGVQGIKYRLDETCTPRYVTFPLRQISRHFLLKGAGLAAGERVVKGLLVSL